jgi:hypothetical protein
VPKLAGADEAAADEGAAAEDAGAAADEVDEPPALLVTADEPQADRAATATARTATAASRSRGRGVLRSASAVVRRERRATACGRCIKFPPIGSLSS